MVKVPIIKFVKLQKNAILPTYSHNDDAGFDLHSMISTVIKRGEYKPIPTGLSSEIPPGWFISFRDKSGLALKAGISVLGGVIDSGYRGEWIVILINLGNKSFKVEKGAKIAQGILQASPQARFVEVKKLSDSKRGKKGFGSTGRK